MRIDPAARSMSPPGPARRARAWKRSFPRSSPTPGGRAGRRHHRPRRHRGHPDRLGTIASRSTVTLSAAITRKREAAREDLRHRRQQARMRARRPRAAQRPDRRGRGARHEVTFVKRAQGRAARLGSWPPARRGARATGDLLLRAFHRDLVLRDTRGHRRGEHRDRAAQHRAIRRRPTTAA